MRISLQNESARRMNHALMKRVNAVELLGLIKDHDIISRSALAKISRLSKPTVSDLVRLLEEKNLVVEIGTGKPSSRGGKKPTLIQFNADYGRVIGVDIGAERTRLVSSDLNGKIIAQSEFETHPEKGPAHIVKSIKTGIRKLYRSEPDLQARLKTISVAAPGIVDVRLGVVRETDNVFGWRDVDLRAELASEFEVMVVVDNDVNTAALGELKYGLGQSVANFVLIRLNTGIGAGIVLGGRLYHGSHWAAGEISHMVLNVDAEPSHYSARGYLESVVGLDRVAERVRKIAAQNKKGFAPWADKTEWEALQAASRAGLKAAQALLAEITHHLAAAVANVAAAYDPDLIVLLGDAFMPLTTDIQKRISRMVPWPIEVRLSELGEMASLRGTLVAGLSATYHQISRGLEEVAGNPEPEILSHSRMM